MRMRYITTTHLILFFIQLCACDLKCYVEESGSQTGNAQMPQRGNCTYCSLEEAMWQDASFQTNRNCTTSCTPLHVTGVTELYCCTIDLCNFNRTTERPNATVTNVRKANLTNPLTNNSMMAETMTREHADNATTSNEVYSGMQLVAPKYDLV
ncbi:unnamed protein product [Dicrocoelium dendriticum]|nr:unnamed protein product [Dicrocoelium dendriticum]